MNIVLPLGIENYLRESGLSATDIIVLKKLLEENLLTLRELAAKTGKGMGVIDGALKKLIRYDIVRRDMLNEQPRYTVIDPEAIVSWAQRNLREQTHLMERKHESFMQFMNNIKTTKSHPEISHFSDQAGLEKAYEKLLENRDELLTYTNPENLHDDDSLANFRAQYFRRRRVHGVFQRVIAPNSSASRRFQTRDPFEYRKTILVPDKDYPLSFQKIIVGDTVACFDLQNMQATLLRFPALADSERKAFEHLWQQQIEQDSKSSRPIAIPEATLPEPQREPVAFNILQKIAIGFTAFLVLFWSALFLTQTKDGFYNYFYAFLYGITPLMSGAIALFSAKKWGGLKTSIGKAVTFVGLGIFLWGFGEMMWSYYNFVLAVALPYPSLADFVFSPGTFAYALGVIFLADAAGAKFGLRNIYAKIFVMVAPILALLVSYYFLIIVARGGVLISTDGSVLKTILDIINPLSDFLGLSVSILISGLSFKYLKGGYVYEIWAMVVGLVVMFIADSVFSYTTTVGTYYNAFFGDLLYTLGLFLLSFGVLGFCRDKGQKLLGVA
jgi:predicted transcriptional regulator